MKWILLTLGVLVLIVGLAAVIGLMLPGDHVASTTTTINAPPDSVWEALVNVTDYPRWRTDVRSVDVLSAEGAMRWREHTRQDAITFERTDAQRPTRLETRIADETLPFGGTWTWNLAPDAERHARDDHRARVRDESHFPVHVTLRLRASRDARGFPSCPRPALRARRHAHARVTRR